MVLLNVDGVECCYGSTKILENVNLIVKEGDFVGIIGPNGSGKSTLLKSISRTLKPHKGAILLNKKDIYTLKARIWQSRWLWFRRITPSALVLQLWRLF